jgi:hypothetical protein
MEYGIQQGYLAEYVGLRMDDHSHIYYGWLHKPGDIITEFAIDTSKVEGRNVLAGRKKK